MLFVRRFSFWLIVAALAGCSTTETRSCTWTGANGESQSIVAVKSQRTDADAAQIEALAGIARSAVLGGVASMAPGGSRAKSARTGLELPEVCTRMFAQ